LEKLAIWPDAGSNAVLNTVIAIYSPLALQAQKTTVIQSPKSSLHVTRSEILFCNT
jgi:hypothetical protein